MPSNMLEQLAKRLFAHLSATSTTAASAASTASLAPSTEVLSDVKILFHIACLMYQLSHLAPRAPRSGDGSKSVISMSNASRRGRRVDPDRSCLKGAQTKQYRHCVSSGHCNMSSEKANALAAKLLAGSSPSKPSSSASSSNSSGPSYKEKAPALIERYNVSWERVVRDYQPQVQRLINTNPDLAGQLSSWESNTKERMQEVLNHHIERYCH
ncbi:hypothetical protein M569_17521 [Genlisea aurea]|uniref:Uncharacterized protein n=1 Tax=Genlisea aurea TaxID=192259 RepID=S8BS91_9LAMI|nr:hypothetical protein M569_17521 [Genlisea aurea]